MYNWRKMNDKQRKDVLNSRKLRKNPWHSPPHRQGEGKRFIITATCYEHNHHIGYSSNRMNCFEEELLLTIKDFIDELYAWVILPNHYHLLIKTENVFSLLKALHPLHGRNSFFWNKEECVKGRRIWCGILEKAIKSDNHFYASLNYIHHNPVKHGYVNKWTDWIHSSANDYIKQRGREKVINEWNNYDISEMGKGWDI